MFVTQTWELYKEDAEGSSEQILRFDHDIVNAGIEDWCRLQVIAKAVD